MIVSAIFAAFGLLAYVEGYHAIGAVLVIVGAYCLGYIEGALRTYREPR